MRSSSSSMIASTSRASASRLSRVRRVTSSSASMSYSVNPSRSATVGSTSRGCAMSMQTSRPASATCPGSITGSGLPVAEITRSASGTTAGRSASETASAGVSTSPATNSAFGTVRLATTISETAVSSSVRAASVPISPAPTTTADPSVRSISVAASRTAAEPRETTPSLIEVSLRARSPTCSAFVTASFRTGPMPPADFDSSYASRSWPLIWSSPSTSDSSPAATRIRCSKLSSWSSRRTAPPRMSGANDASASAPSTVRSVTTNASERLHVWRANASSTPSRASRSETVARTPSPPADSISSTVARS